MSAYKAFDAGYYQLNLVSHSTICTVLNVKARTQLLETYFQRPKISYVFSMHALLESLPDWVLVVLRSIVFGVMQNV